MLVFVIINPGAGQGVRLPGFLRRFLRLKKKEVLDASVLRQRIQDGFRAQDIVPTIEYTLYPGHAVELSRQAAAQGYNAVVAVGGDGTVNEVVNGLAGTDTALGIILAGTANLLAGELNLPADIATACAVIAAGRTKTIDLGVIDGRYFTMMAGIGFDAHVVRLVDRKLKGRWGAFSYLIVLFREFFRYGFKPIDVVTETGERLRGYYIFVQNAATYGSGFSASPESTLDDGRFELIIFPRRSFFSVLRYLLAKKKDTQAVVKRSILRLEVLTPHEVQIDGDFSCFGPAEISLHELSLRVLVC
ncbi:MAG: diacylglycerol kinase family lipid kinase [Alphaproteobacteria bacterium]|nr:diacylglycerol kinase family lipid kinase [Alphaproteobacteria bacterium]MBP7759416.1 diacylglycerol kinase family lipid kinase [Alphaproteobacteria bacterium]MBP7762693.1 diacylglycerol kinase family lipid kinase [Alphaproteobacteria bacterium]MBP7905006.1 diacylglycerol kinase family lipid kinase [Alphaproteobacteria bacterium]